METNRIDQRRVLSLPVASALPDHDPAGVAPIGSEPRDISVVSPVPVVTVCSAALVAAEPIYAAVQFSAQGLGVFASKVSPSPVASMGLSISQGPGAGLASAPKSVGTGLTGVGQQQGIGVAEAMASLMAKRRGVPPRGKPECPA